MAQAFLFFAGGAVVTLAIGIAELTGAIRGGVVFGTLALIGFVLCCWVLYRGYRVVRSGRQEHET